MNKPLDVYFFIYLFIGILCIIYIYQLFNWLVNYKNFKNSKESFKKLIPFNFIIRNKYPVVYMGGDKITEDAMNGVPYEKVQQKCKAI